MGGPRHLRWYLQELLSPQLALEVPGAQASLEFRWAQRHQPGLSPPETPGCDKNRVRSEGPHTALTRFPKALSVCPLASRRRAQWPPGPGQRRLLSLACEVLCFWPPLSSSPVRPSTSAPAQ